MTEAKKPYEPPRVTSSGQQMKPSQINLTASAIPLTECFGRVEREAAATLMVRALQLGGDEFRPLRQKEIGLAIKHDLDNGISPLAGLDCNPLWRPDFNELIQFGFARWTTDEPHPPIEFTALGLERLRRFWSPG